MEFEISLPFLTLFVTYLHELGHVIGALLTGGTASSLQVNMDGSGVATTAGGIRSVVEAAGYLGSILFGNLLLRIGVRHSCMSRYALLGLGILMMVSSVIWHSTIASFAFTMLNGIVLVLLSRLKGISGILLGGLGLYSVIYAIWDFNVGPTSDLKAFAGIIPAVVWMYVWLVGALGITGYNVWTMLRKRFRK